MQFLQVPVLEAIKDDPIESIILRVWFAILAVSILLLIEKGILNVFAMNFQKRAYKERVTESENAYHVLAVLSHSKKKKFHNRTESAEKDDSNFVKEFGKDLGHKIGGFGKHLFRGLGHIAGAAVGIRIGTNEHVALSHPDDAKHLSRRIFDRVAGSKSQEMYESDFKPFFKCEVEAKKAFSYLDNDDNGDLTRDELKASILKILRERQALERSLKQCEQAVDKLDSFFKAFVYILSFFAIAYVFEMNTTQLLTTSITISASLVFAFGGTVKGLVESLIFLFANHPYDIGDKVEIEGQSFVVKEFGLNMTTFIRNDGKEFYAPNLVLA